MLSSRCLKTVIVLGAGLGIAAPIGAVQGQTRAATVTGEVFAQPISARDIERAYPKAAKERGIGGEARLRCLIQADGLLACSVISETPAGQGFGQAALRLMAERRARPATPAGQPTAGAVYVTTIRFSVARNRT
jgi:TonB family protein